MKMSLIFKNSPSIKHFSSLLIVMLLVMATFLNVADCRVLRSTEGVDAAARDQQIEGAGSIGRATFVVSSDNSSSSKSSSSSTTSFSDTVKSLATKLASGPSKRGPGH